VRLLESKKNVNTVCFANNGVINNALCKLWSNVQYLGVMSTNNTGLKYYVAEASGFDNATQELLIFNFFKSVHCDVIISQLNSFYLHMLAKTEDIYSVAWSSDMRQFIGETVLTSVRKNWEVPMSEFINDIFAGNYSAHVYEDSYANHGVDLAPLSNRDSPAAASYLRKVERKLSEGKINVFCGAAVKSHFGTDCTTEANLSSIYLPNIVVVNAKNL